MSRALRAVVIGIACAVAYAPVLAASFVYDDLWTILDNPFITRPENLLRLLVGDVPPGLPDGPRPFMVATTILDHALFGLDPIGWHLDNLLWHAGCAWLVCEVAQQLSRSARIATAAGLVFAVHATHTEAVASISYREDLIAGVALLAGMLAAIRGAAGGGAGVVAFGCGALLAGTNAKESVVMFPALLVLYELSAFDRGARSRRRWLWPYAPLVLASLCSRFWIGVLSGSSALEHARVDRALTASALLFTEAKIWLAGVGQQLLPIGLSADYVTQVTRAPDLHAVAAIALILGLLLAGAVSLRRAPLLGFSLLWYFLNLLPTANLVPMENLRADRYLYVSSAGTAWIAAGALVAASRRLASGDARREARIFGALLAGLLVFHAALTFARARVWHDELTLWHATAATTPDSVRAPLALASEYRRRGDLDAAIAQARRALALAPRNAAIHVALGAVYSEQGLQAKAIEHLERARALGDAADSTAADELALAWYRAGEGPRAVDLLRDAIGRSPGEGRLHLHLGQILFAAGRDAEAAAALREATRLLPDDADGHRFLAQALLRLDRRDEALASIRRALALAPQDRRSRTVLLAIQRARRRVQRE